MTSNNPCKTTDCYEPRVINRTMCVMCMRDYHKKLRQRRTGTCSTSGCRTATGNEFCQQCERDGRANRLRTESKRCKSCGEDRKLIEYGARVGAPDGRCVTCKPCSRARHAKAQARKGESRNAIMRKKHENLESLGELCTKWLRMPL